MGLRLSTTIACLTSLGLVVGGHAGFASGVSGHPFSFLAPSVVVERSGQVVLRRVNAYRSGGLAMLPPYADRREYTHPQDAFEAILDASASLKACLPDVVARLRDYPHAQLPVVESFFYWSKEQYGAGKRVVAVTHVEIVKPAREHPQEVIVLGKEIFATHYRNASLGTTAIVRDPAGNARYLVYINRSHVDVLGGLFGGLKRKLIEGRLKTETAEIIRHVRDRLSGGAPAGRTDMFATPSVL